MEKVGVEQQTGEEDTITNAEFHFHSHAKYLEDDETLTQLRKTIGLISRLLDYPSEIVYYDSLVLQDKLDCISEWAEVTQGILGFFRAVQKEPLSKLRAKYVSLFDFSNKTTMNLTYHIFGEERDRMQKTQRGSALLLLKSLYSEAGLRPSKAELSDYLPMALEFVAIAPEYQGMRVAELIKEPIQVLQKNLEELETGEGREYALLLHACVDALNEFISIGKSRVNQRK